MSDPLSIFVCPKCRGALARADGALACTACPGRYQLVADDIPIFVDEADRPPHVPDPGIPFGAAIDLAERLHRTPGDFHALVDAYYEYLRGDRDPALWTYYRDLTKSRRVSPFSEEVSMVASGLDLLGTPFPRTHLALEFGCGWGFSLAAFAINRITTPALRAARVCGFDLNPAILVIARRLFRDLGLDGLSLAVADATRALPFADGAVDLIYSNGVVEHIPQQDRLMQTLGRALSADSVLHFLIPNRYMIHPEPHYAVRWVGFVPRPLQRKYVGYRLGLQPEYVETILSYSPTDLASLMGRNFPTDLLCAMPCRPTDAPAWKRAVFRSAGRLGVNRYHCLVRRYPGETPHDALRGQLQLTSVVGGPLRRATVYRAPDPATAAAAP